MTIPFTPFGDNSTIVSYLGEGPEVEILELFELSRRLCSKVLSEVASCCSHCHGGAGSCERGVVSGTVRCAGPVGLTSSRIG